MQSNALNCETAHLTCNNRLTSSLIKNCVSIEQRNPFMLQYISRPDLVYLNRTVTDVEEL